MSDYLELARKRAQPAAPEVNYDEIAARRVRDMQANLRISTEVASKRDPDQHALRLKMADSMGLPSDVVERQELEATYAARKREINPEALAVVAPATARWASVADNLSVAHDDLKSLKGLEWWIGRHFVPAGPTLAGPMFLPLDEGAISRSVKVGMFQRERSHLLANAMLANVDPDTVPRIKELGEFMGRDYGKRDHGLLGKMVTGTLETSSSLLSGVLAAGAGSATGAAAGLYGGPAAGISVPAAAGFGALAGVAYDTFEQEAGSAYGEIIASQKARGVPVNTRLAAAGATIIGTMNGLAEAGFSSVIPIAFPFLKKPLAKFLAATTQKTTGRVFASQTPLKAAIRAASGFGLELAAEVGTEVAQQAVTSVGREITLAASGARPDFSTLGSELIDELVGSLESVLLLILPGSAGQFGSDLTSSRNGKAAQVRLERLNRIMTESKLAGRLPAAAEGFINSVVAAGDAQPNVFVRVDDFAEYFQSQNIDPGVAAAELGQGAAYQEAAANGGDLSIPLSAYATRIARSKHAEALAQITRFSPLDMTAKEATEYEGKLKEFASLVEKQEAEDKAAPDVQVYERRRQQLIDAGVPDRQAEHYARVHQAFMRTVGARVGKQATELSDAFPLSITRDGIEAKPTTTQEFNQGEIDPATGEPAPLQQEKRGVLRVKQGPKGREFEIGLLKGQDLSTVLHESGHYFLEVFGDIAEDSSAPTELKDDFVRLMEFLGVDERDQITREHHEKFARAFESYVGEGKAPSPQLATAFARFRAWLVSLYRKLSSLGVELTDDVRGVMDRMLATQEEIDAVHGQMSYGPMFSSENEAESGMTPEQFAAYQASSEVVKEEARQRLLVEIGQSIKKDQTEERAAERVLREAVTEEVYARPGVQALMFFRNGQMVGTDAEIPAGLKTEKGETLKLAEDGVKAALDLMDAGAQLREIAGGEEARGYRRPSLRGLRGAMAKEGIDPDVAAEYFGFASGAEMVTAMLADPTPAKTIREETKRRLNAKYPDRLAADQIAEAAQETLHTSSGIVQQFQREMAALYRLSNRGGRPTPAAVAAMAAEATAGRTKFRDLDPARAIKNEADNRREAIKEASAGNFDAAIVLLERSLLNHYLYLQLKEARARSVKNAAFADRHTREEARARIGRASQDTLAQVDKITERFDFRKASTLKAADRRESLAAWIAKTEAEGGLVQIPDEVLNEGFRTNWRNLTVDELQGVRDSIENLATLATLKNTLMDRGKRRNKAEVIAEFTAQISKAYPGVKPPEIDATVLSAVDAGIQKAQWIDAELLKVETMIDWIDQGDINGVARRILFDGIAAGQDRESKLGEKVYPAVVKAIEKLPGFVKEAQRKTAGKRLNNFYLGRPLGDTGLTDPDTGKPIRISRGGLMALALNVGNDGNYTKTIKGWGWTPEQFERALSRLTREERNAVQEIWDALESLWPEIDALNRRETGLPLKKVAARSFTVTFGDGTTETYRGGYFPIVYDPKRSTAGAKQAAPLQKGVAEEGYIIGLPSASHTKERIDNFARPVLVDIEGIPRQLTQVIHYIAMREPVKQTWNFLADERVAKEIKNRMGVQRYKVMLAWLRGVANDRVRANAVSDSLIEKAVMASRANITAAAMGFKATVGLQNFANIIISFRYAKGRELASAYNDFRKDFDAVNDFITAKSSEMKFRQERIDRDVRDAILSLKGRTDWKARAQMASYWHIGFTDQVTSRPLWLAVYKKEVKAGRPDADAVRSADRAVRMTHGAGAAKDLAEIQRQPGTAKLLTMFYGYMSVVYQLQRTDAREASLGLKDRDGQRVAKAMARTFALFLATQIVSDLLSGRGPDDDESAAAWWARRAASFPFAGIPFIRDLANAAEQGLRGQVPAFRFSPVVSALARAWESDAILAKAIVGKPDVTPAKVLNALFSSVALLGMPGANQAKLSSEYIAAVLSGDETPKNAADIARGIAFGLQKDRRKKK